MTSAKNLIDEVVARAMDYEASHEFGSSVAGAKIELDKAVSELKQFIANMSPPKTCTTCKYFGKHGDELNSFSIFCELAWRQIDESSLAKGVKPFWCPLRKDDND